MTQFRPRRLRREFSEASGQGPGSGAELGVFFPEAESRRLPSLFEEKRREHRLVASTKSEEWMRTAISVA